MAFPEGSNINANYTCGTAQKGLLHGEATLLEAVAEATKKPQISLRRLCGEPNATRVEHPTR